MTNVQMEAQHRTAVRPRTLSAESGRKTDFHHSSFRRRRVKSRGLKRAEQRLACERAGVAETGFTLLLHLDSIIAQSASGIGGAGLSAGEN